MTKQNPNNNKIRPAKRPLLALIGISLSTATSIAHAEGDNIIPEIYITGGEQEILTTPGSAHLVDEEALETFEYTDPHQVLSSVPGVYIRDEDGFGLRPNIGMRGAPAERTQKIAVMEDGVLIAPAPYSAPAAYYFPNIARMHNVEVFKGPVSIQYGPNTAGGAINMITTPIPREFGGKVEAAVGSFGFNKLHATIGNSHDNLAWLVEGLTFGSDGFKEIDGGGDTGFERNDIMAKLRYEFDTERYQRLDLKIDYADEVSHETYLGLTDDDLYADPYRRYSASQLDKMEWEHTQLVASYFTEVNDSVDMSARLYRNEFTRAWNKLDGFHESSPVLISDVLSDPDANVFNERFYDILTGALDSNGDANQSLVVGNNDRDYLSQGLELTFTGYLEQGDISHEIDLGIRFHRDTVERNETAQTYDMIGGDLVNDGEARSAKAIDEAQTDALAIFLKDKLLYKQWTITAGLRGEFIQAEFTDHRDSSNDVRRQTNVLIPGVGAFYQYTPELGFLAGVHGGFTPNNPAASDDIDPEEAINTEFGLRYNSPRLYVEAIGFYNRYSNMVGRCRGSDTDCEGNDEFNAGRVDMLGLEFTSKYQHQLGDWQMPMQLIYTYTDTSFQSSFNSDFSQWGPVTKGDSLPYVAEHQFNAQVELEKGPWNFALVANYVGEMQERASSDSIKTDAYIITNLASSYDFNDQLKLQVGIDNLFDEVTIVSRRPFGARPNKPRTVIGTLKYAF